MNFNARLIYFTYNQFFERPAWVIFGSLSVAILIIFWKNERGAERLVSCTPKLNLGTFIGSFNVIDVFKDEIDVISIPAFCVLAYSLQGLGIFHSADIGAEVFQKLNISLPSKYFSIILISSLSVLIGLYCFFFRKYYCGLYVINYALLFINIVYNFKNKNITNIGFIVLLCLIFFGYVFPVIMNCISRGEGDEETKAPFVGIAIGNVIGIILKIL